MQRTESSASATVTRKSRALEQRLHRRLGEVWKPGDRLPPIEKLARDMGVGITNMRRAAKSLADRGLLIARPGSGTFVAPSLVAVPDGDTSRSDSADTPLAGKIVHLLLSSQSTDGMLREMLRAATDEIADAGATVVQDLWRSTDPDDLRRRVADAIMLFNPQERAGPDCRDDQWVTQISTVIVPKPRNCRGYDMVSIDQEQGAELAGAYAREQGYGDFLFIGHTGVAGEMRLDRTSELRLRGFERGIGASVDTRHLIRAKGYDYFHGTQAAAAFVRLAAPPPLIFAACDELAIGFMFGMTAHGRAPGQDYQIIGFDALKIARWGAGCGVPFTSVETPAVAMGKAAGRLLVERARDPDVPTRNVQLTCSLMVGRSVRPAKQAVAPGNVSSQRSLPSQPGEPS